ncbi:hypothetical protein AQ490_01440 [Wenjunlia vitaminophila]|uniref:DUF4192 domain-containing protein n=1 Tax=Wenjunlia vitaminophila TaxID=76728 RepID=A0A0T6LZ28_WENVI|nr:DUF4192 domain-containing protein [Wenjunlia vitaminophila]KRV51447.1 hypothetical protein AQ490_01440 [Wenjunlia vitaminophila]
MTSHTTVPQIPTVPHVTLSDSADLADALPYLMGFRPDDSVVLMALHRPHGRFGARLHVGIPQDPAQWRPTAELLAHHLVHGSERRAGRPDGIVVYLCRDPAPGSEARAVMEELRPLAQALRLACGALEVPVWEALCVSDGRWWSYVCADDDRCSGAGTPVRQPGTSVMAAAAAYAGIRVRGTLSEMESRFLPVPGGAAEGQARALHEASRHVVPRLVDQACAAEVREETAVLLASALERFRQTPSGGGSEDERDRRDDAILDDHEAATIILGLQDRTARDRAAEWMELPDAEPALRLWRALARRCVAPYLEHAAAPVTLAGWVAWSLGDPAEAKVAFRRALTLDPEYTFARLLHEACNGGLDPEPLRRCLREERDGRG